MKKFMVIALLLILAARGAAAAPPKKSILEENLDKKTIFTLLEYGQLMSLIYDEKGTLTHRMCAALVNAPPDLVWEVINDFGNYNLFVPDMEAPVVKALPGGKTRVDFTLKIKIVAGIGTTQKYATLYEPRRPRLYMHNPDAEADEPGFWEVVPASGGKQTMLFYYDRVPDLEKMGKLVAGVVSAKPELALALQVSPISILLNETKAYAEKLARKKK